MLRIFRIMDLVVSLLLSALAIGIYLITKNWIATGLVGIVYIAWEVTVFITYKKVLKETYFRLILPSEEDEEDDDWEEQ